MLLMVLIFLWGIWLIVRKGLCLLKHAPQGHRKTVRKVVLGNGSPDSWAARFQSPEVGFSCVTGKAKLPLLPISAELLVR